MERTKDLIAVHNKDWAVIRDAALNWGGIPSPSVAIVDAKEGHVKYGDTSVVYPRATIDPQTDSRNRVYGSDAWTPTSSSARVEREVSYDTKRRIESSIERLSRQTANGIFSNGSVLGSAGIEDVTDLDAKEIARKLAAQDAVKAAYLASRGEDIDVVHKAKEYVSRETFELQTKLTEAEKNNAILSADLASEKKMVEVYNAASDRINGVREELSGRILDLERTVASNAAAQGVINCGVQSSLAVANSQIAQLMSLTMLKIPNTSVCPGWGTVKVTPETTTTTTT